MKSFHVKLLSLTDIMTIRIEPLNGFNITIIVVADFFMLFISTIVKIVTNIDCNIVVFYKVYYLTICHWIFFHAITSNMRYKLHDGFREINKISYMCYVKNIQFRQTYVDCLRLTTLLIVFSGQLCDLCGVYTGKWYRDFTDITF